MALNVDPASIEWARKHIKKFGDTDLLPTPFEFESINADWAKVYGYLKASDFENWKPQPARRYLVPKPNNGFRVVHQLDPLDALMYVAVMHQFAGQIEDYRVPMAQRVVCSYRIAIKGDGVMFAAEDGWPEFHRHSKELCETGKYKYVAIADIGDFYNQIYTHRVETALESAGVAENWATGIECFLLHVGGANQSQGIPVGPTPSIILAEAVLTDIDTMLMKRGYAHVRYVDDFRIFCVDEATAAAALHDLTDHLYTAHRLSLQPLKSRVLSLADFQKIELLDPQEEEERTRKATIAKMMADLKLKMRYSSVEEELPKTKENEALLKSVRELFVLCVKDSILHSGVARYLLRRARELRTSEILPLVIENLPKLCPVMRDVCRYLQRVLTDKVVEVYKAPLHEFLKSAAYARTPFVLEWMLWLFSERIGLATATEAFTLGDTAIGTLGLRPLAAFMHAHRQVDWIRSKKESILSMPSWDRRALIRACDVLPKKERSATLEQIMGRDDVIDSAVAKASLAV